MYEIYFFKCRKNEHCCWTSAGFFHNNKEKNWYFKKNFCKNVNHDHSHNSILFFSKLDVPIRWISKNFKVHSVFLIDAPNIFLGNLWPKVFENVLFSGYMVMVHFQPFFGFLIGRVTQQFYQDLKKVGHSNFKD